MREFFDYEGGYTQIASRIFDALVLGILWLLLCLPVVTAGAATTALYYALVKSVRNHRGYALQEFWRGFRTNWRQATLIWTCVAGVFLLCLCNLRILDLTAVNNGTAFLLVLYLAGMVADIAFAVYVFPVISRFEGSVRWFVRLALYMTVRYLGTTVMCLLVLVMAGIFLWRLPILILILPAGVCYLFSEFLERVLHRHAPEETS